MMKLPSSFIVSGRMNLESNLPAVIKDLKIVARFHPVISLPGISQKDISTDPGKHLWIDNPLYHYLY